MSDEQLNPTPEVPAVADAPVSAVPETPTVEKAAGTAMWPTPPSPKKVFGAFDTTGAAEVFVYVSEDHGKVLGDPDLYLELESFVRSNPLYSSNFPVAPAISTPVVPESEDITNE